MTENQEEKQEKDVNHPFQDVNSSFQEVNPLFTKIYNKYKNLAQYKNLPDSEIRRKAQDYVDEVEKEKAEKDELDVSSMFNDKLEKKDAKILVDKYLKDYVIETVSDRNTLRQLIFLEVFHQRLQRELNYFHEQEQPTPIKTVESLHSNLREITTLKAKLGLSKDKKEVKDNALLALETLKRKLKKWGEENRGSRTLVCPFCSKMILLRIRTTAFEAQKHPFFIDRILCNKHLVRLYLTGKITKQDVAKVLETSPDYTEWLVQKWGNQINTEEERRDGEHKGDGESVGTGHNGDDSRG